ncbi:MAG TPA: hypothetical protein VK427_04360, partial [Kofleriaceae bacterium]|nr:hypothetical protein [Kofleriaceae bacterium]
AAQQLDQRRAHAFGQAVAGAEAPDFVAGLGYGKLTDAPADGQGMAPVQLRVFDVCADATLRATRDRDTFAVRLRRAFEPTYTDELLLDIRLDAGWQRTRRAHVFHAGAFAALTKRFDRTGGTAATPSGGLRGAYVRGQRALRVTLAGEVARSFYAGSTTRARSTQRGQRRQRPASRSPRGPPLSARAFGSDRAALRSRCACQHRRQSVGNDSPMSPYARRAWSAFLLAGSAAREPQRAVLVVT